MKSYSIKKIIFIFVFILGVYQISFAQCTTTLNPGANIAAAVSSAANGATICLNNGSYGSVAFANISKSSLVTLKSVNSKGATFGYTEFWSSDYIKLEDIVIGGAIINACSTNIHIVNSKFTSGLTIRNTISCSPQNNVNHVIDGNTFDNLGVSTWEGRLSIGQVGSDTGIVIKNNVFSGSGPSGNCSDGIQLVGGAGGVKIGPGNIFKNIIQGSCAAHVDSIQTYGAGPGNVIEGNYFINNTINIGIYDGGSDYTVIDNIFDIPNNTGWQALQLGGIKGMLMEHNTFRSNIVGVGTKAGNSPNSGWKVQNNIFDSSSFTAAGDQPGCGADCIMRYNMKSRNGSTSPTGTNNITGNAVWVGIGSVDNWSNWQLASSSPGKNSGSDGKDMGATYFGLGKPTSNITQPSSPTNLRVVK